MTDRSAQNIIHAFGAEVAIERIVFHSDSHVEGPLLVIVAGLHGNELNGIASLREAEADLTPRTGAVVGILGNLAALRRNVRYVDEDLNRAFIPGRSLTGSAEEAERAALAATLQHLRHSYPGRDAWLIDLHGTSGHSPPYLSLLGSEAAWPLRGSLPVPEVTSFERMFSGTLVEHVARSGWKAATLEAGAMTAPVSVMNGVSFLRLLADALGIRELAPGLRDSLSKGLAAQAPVTGAHSFAYRHDIQPADGFVMNPGFVSFQPVRAGEILGRDRNGEVAAPFSARLLMPLYQAQGQSGFYLVQTSGHT